MGGLAVIVSIAVIWLTLGTLAVALLNLAKWRIQSVAPTTQPTPQPRFPTTPIRSLPRGEVGELRTGTAPPSTPAWPRPTR